MFCLAATEKLSYELQRKCAETMELSVARMREVEEHKEMDPIVVITGQSEKQHLLAQFGDLRRKSVRAAFALTHGTCGSDPPAACI